MKQKAKRVVASLLRAESQAVLARYQPSIVAVTGSVGKTSTKDAIFTAFSAFARTRKSEKSFNSDIGVPLTVLGLKNAWSNPVGWLVNLANGLRPLLYREPYPQWLVLEVGADRPGDIRSVGAWVKPHITVLTALPSVPVHVEFFASPQEVAEEKLSLVDALRTGGTVVANADDPMVIDGVRRRARTAVTYGFGEIADVRASEYRVVYAGEGPAALPTGIMFTVSAAGQMMTVSIPGIVGVQQVYPALAAIAAARAAGFDAVKAAESLSLNHRPAPGRMRLLAGVNGSTIIDDSYNSSPAAAQEAVRALREVRAAGRKIAVLGDMLELGKYSVAEHEALGRAASFADVVVTVGPRARDCALAAAKAGKNSRDIHTFADSRAAAAFLSPIVATGDIVLVKGSQGTRLERVSAALLAVPEDAPKLLVRQEEEWQRR